MISPERETEILKLFHAEKWLIGTIAAQLGHHHSTVRRVLGQAGIAAGQSMARPSIVDDFIPPVEVGKTSYARFDLNDYSVPHDRVRRTVTVVASLDQVRVFDGQHVIATHTRCWDRAKQIETPEHLERLRAVKRKGREHRTLDRLHQSSAPQPEISTNGRRARR